MLNNFYTQFTGKVGSKCFKMFPLNVLNHKLMKLACFHWGIKNNSCETQSISLHVVGIFISHAVLNFFPREAVIRFIKRRSLHCTVKLWSSLSLCLPLHNKHTDTCSSKIWDKIIWTNCDNFFNTDWIGLSSVLRPRQDSIGYMGDGFYRSKDPTNITKVLKEQIVHRQIKHTISRHEMNTKHSNCPSLH